jgi:hypothetical protein
MAIEYAARLMDEMRSNNEVDRRGFYKDESAPASRYCSVFNLKNEFHITYRLFLKIHKITSPKMPAV